MVGVALEGGGARGSYHVGALIALRKCGIYPKCFVGTSIGSVNAALAACNDYKTMEHVWKEVSCEELFNVDSNLIKAIEQKKIDKKVIQNGLKTIREIISNSGIDTTNLKKIYKENIDEKVLRNSDIDFGLVTYGLSDRKPIEIFKRDIPNGKLHEYLIASCYLPVFKMEKIIDDKYYIDGGFHDVCPVNMLIREGYNEIYAIRTYGPGITQKVIPNNAKIIYIAPKKKLGSIILFDEDSVKYNMNLGFYDALRVLKKLDGNEYYIRRRDKAYYDLMCSNISKKQLNRMFLSLTDTKKITLRVIESLMKEYNFELFKVYNLPFLILKLKRLMKHNTDHKYYNFIKKLKIVF